MHRKHRIPRLVFDHGIRRYKRNTNDTICNNTRSGIQSNMHHSNSIISSYSIPIGCSVALLLLGIVCINPVVGLNGWFDDSVYADEPVPYSDGTTSLSIAFDDNVDSKSQNVSAGTVGYISAGFKVTATGIDDNGYSIYAQAADGYSNNLVGQANTSSTISPLAKSTMGSDIPANYWGYSIVEGSITSDNLANTTYSALPANGTSTTAVYSNTTPATNKQFTLAAAANIGTDKPADHYKTTVLLSVAAGAEETTIIGDVGFAGYTYMQEITKDKCDASSIAVGTEGRLIDRRDGKVYWVAKLKDGLCWMTQNLDYDGGAVDGYLGDDAVALTYGTSFRSNTQAELLYYDPGAYLYTTPTSSRSCDTTTDIGLKGCIDKGWATRQDLIDPTWFETDNTDFYAATSYMSVDNKMLCTKQANSWLGNMTSDYLPCRIYNIRFTVPYEHYLAGNFYNWQAATAGTGNSIKTVGTEASGSICPTGWKLPNQGTNTGSFYSLIVTMGGTIASGGSTSNLEVRGQLPYLLTSGEIYVSPTKISFAGSSSHYWLAISGGRSSGGNDGMTLDITGNTVYPSHPDGLRYYGYSVRCVAR